MSKVAEYFTTLFTKTETTVEQIAEKLELSAEDAAKFVKGEITIAVNDAVTLAKDLQVDAHKLLAAQTEDQLAAAGVVSPGQAPASTVEAVPYTGSPSGTAHSPAYRDPQDEGSATF